MELSRVKRRQLSSRQNLIKMTAIIGKAAITFLLIVSWLIDPRMVFRMAALILLLSLLTVNYGNMRRYIPGLNSQHPLKRQAVILVYMLILIGLLSSEA